MKDKWLIIFFFISCVSWSQSLKEDIHASLIEFQKSPSEESLGTLYTLEKSFFKNKQPKTADDYLALLNLYVYIGHSEHNHNRLLKASDALEKAWKLYQEHNFDYDITEYCLKILGNIYTKLGNYTQAENIIKSYLQLAATTGNLYHYSSAVNNLSICYNYSFKSTLAKKILEITLKNRSFHPSKEGDLYYQMAETYFFLNEFEQAQQALKHFKNFSQNKNAVYRYHVLKAKIFLANDQFSEALAAINQVINHQKDFIHTKRELAKNYIIKAKAEFALAHHEQALATVQSIFELLCKDYDFDKRIPEDEVLYVENTLIDALDLLGQIFVSEDDLKSALIAYKKSYALSISFSTLYFYEQATLINLSYNRLRLEKILALYHSLLKQNDETIHVTETLYLHEQTKNFFISAQNKPERSIVDKKLFAQLQELQYSIDVAQDQTQLQELIAKQNELFLKLKSINQTSAEETSATLNIAEVQQKLNKQKATFFQYFMGQKHLYQWQINDANVSFNQLPLASIRPVLEKYLGFFEKADLIDRNFDSFLHTSHKLYSQLNMASKTQRIYVVTDGLLDQLSFESLLYEPSEQRAYAKLPYLLKKQQVLYSFSLTDFMKNHHRSKGNEILGVFPVFKNSSRALDASEEELIFIKEQVKGKFLSHEEANFMNFKKYSAQYDVIHLATHAYALDSLGDAKLSFIDQDISFKQLYSLQLKHPLVVLSACETGIGKNYSGEGSMSVARGFRFAGAESIIFSLWKTNDFSTSKIMEGFYKNVSSNSHSVSLHLAKHQYLNDPKISDNKKSPYYWSSFVYYGQESEKESYFFYVFLSLIVIGLVFFFVYKRRQSI